MIINTDNHSNWSNKPGASEKNFLRLGWDAEMHVTKTCNNLSQTLGKGSQEVQLSISCEVLWMGNNRAQA